MKKNSECCSTIGMRMGVGLLALIFLPMAGWAGPVNETNKWAWAENAGHINFRATNAAVSAEFAATAHVDGENGYLMGWAWSEMLGWIKLGNTNGGVPYANADATNWGVNVAGALVCGFAWSESAGWIHFAPTNATRTNRVTFSAATGQFDGYAWSELAGWVHVRGGGETPMYALGTDGPTRVVLYDLFLRMEGGVVQACWQTASEEDSVGFDLFRWDGAAWVKVNESLVMARDPMGAEYCVADAGANGTEAFLYKLVEVETDGGVREYGPFERAVWTPRLENVGVDKRGVVLRWLSREGESYEVRRGRSLMVPLDTITNGLPATPPVNEFVDEEKTEGAAFYQIRVEE